MDRPYEKLIVWQEAYKLCLNVYQYTAAFPDHERFGLMSQMRRSSYSVPTNITEGNARRSAKEKIRFFRIAQSSLEELHCECRLSQDLKYLTDDRFKEMDDYIQRVSYLLTKLIAAVK